MASQSVAHFRHWDTCPGNPDKLPGSSVPGMSSLQSATDRRTYAGCQCSRSLGDSSKGKTGSVALLGIVTLGMVTREFYDTFDGLIGHMYSHGFSVEDLSGNRENPTMLSIGCLLECIKFSKFNDVLDRMQGLPNVVVRFRARSECHWTGYAEGLDTSTILSDSVPSGAAAFECKAYQHEGKCNGCRACYDKSVSVVAYKAHGVKMAKVIRILFQIQSMLRRFLPIQTDVGIYDKMYLT